MFVPSLSWQNYHLWYTNGSKEGVFQTIITLVELLARYPPHVDLPAYIYIYIYIYTTAGDDQVCI
jgi:hypothetical protein